MLRKKIVALSLVACLGFSAVACGGKNQEAEPAAVVENPTPEVTEVPKEEEPAAETVDENLFGVGDFDDGLGEYYTYLEGGEASLYANEDNEMQVDITKTGEVAHGVQVYHDGFGLQKGVEYEFSCDIHGNQERSVDWRFQINGGDYHAYADGKIAVTTDMQHVVVNFVMEEASDPAPRFCFNMGYVDEFKAAGVEPSSISQHSVMVDNLCLKVKDASQAVNDRAEDNLSHARVNQIGYAASDEKYVVFADLEDGDNSYTVLDVAAGKSVFEGTIDAAKADDITGEKNSKSYFTQVNTPGTYKIVTSKGMESYEFKIGDDIYDDTLAKAVNMLYLQRCGCELDEKYAGDFAHPICHNTKAKIYGTDKEIDVTGGWHDAGDYGRYIVAAAKTVEDLFLAYNANPKAFSDNMNIPESGNGISDILDEARYELDWMLKMQNPDNGGVYHKVTCANFPAFVMPQEETAELIVCPVSNTATADFAAIMAEASVVYKKIDPSFSKTALAASKKAFDYLGGHMQDSGFKNPVDISTGEYPDETFADEMLWAAASLYKVTGDEKYFTAMEEAYAKVKTCVDNKEMMLTDLGWMGMAGYGCYTALTTDSLSKKHSDFYNKVKSDFMSQVDQKVDVAQRNAYNVTREADFEWGSNMGIANDGIAIAMARSIEDRAQYEKAAAGCVNYLFGCNATDYCFVTGAGTKFPEHPHHRPSQAVGKTVPGMLVGGVDNALEDPYVANVLKGKASAKCYADSDQSYSTNEVTIYWNSPLICLLAMTE